MNINKGLGSLLSFVILTGITITAIAIVLSTSQNTVGNAITSVDVKDAETLLSVIDNRIREVASEGNGSTRIISFTTPGRFEIMPEEDAIQFETQTGLLDYFTRSLKGNIIFINGNDVSCGKKDVDGDGDTDLFMENSFARVSFQYINHSLPLSSINTSTNILGFRSKTLNDEIDFSDTSVMIDGNSSAGVGYTEILKEGTNLPECTVHTFVNSLVDYDIYYVLYAGADFITAEVKIKQV